MQSKTFHIALFFLLFSVGAYATPHNTIILDGRPTEYTTNDLRGAFSGEGEWAPENVITNLYITWDETYLYVALQGWEQGNKLVVMLDVDPGEGTGATTTTNWADIQPAHIGFNAVGWQAADATGIEFGLDYMIATEGFFNDILRIRYDGIEPPDTNNVELIFSAGNGNTPQGTPTDMVVQADGTDCVLKGLEARIPWSELYTDDNRFGMVGDNVVPTGATIRVFANLHNNEFDISFSSPDTIPAQGAGADYDDGLLTTDTYIEVVIDSTMDGMPDDWSGGVHAPFLRDVMGKAGGDIVYARFNKPVTTESATNTANWWVGGLDIHSITNPLSDIVYIFLNEPLPTNGLLEVRADGVADGDGRTRETWLCLSPAEDGLGAPLTVRFVLETNSGMGRSRSGDAWGASAFFLNGDSPLEWGFPPSMITPVDNASLGGSLRYADVIFPPGTPLTVNYKFSALLTGTGTNNYEAVRLDNYLTATRVLTLDPDALDNTMYVTNHLGAAAGPLRGADVEDAYEDLYWDWDRGDAGVRKRKTITFQLDLSAYDTSEIQRVLIQGTDPLRGFNLNDGGISDWAGLASVGWANGGITLFDDGTMGDAVAGDGIFSRTWSMTADGADSAIVPGSPHSLVGGSSGTSPYGGGAAWVRDRTPRSFKYQYYVINEWGDVLNSPGFDVEVYIEPGSDTNIVFEPFVWDGGPLDDPRDDLDLELPTPTNAPNVFAVAHVDGNIEVSYSNVEDQQLHLVDFSDDLIAGFRHYGDRLPFVNSGVASLDTPNDDVHFFRIRAGRRPPYRGVQWHPNPVPETGGVARIYFRQQRTPFEGNQDVRIAGSFEGWSGTPMTFAGDGLWYYDVVVDESDGNHYFKIRDDDAMWFAAWGVPPDGNYPLYKGTHHATWTPSVAVAGDVFTLTYDAEGGPLEAAGAIYAHSGFDEGWFDVARRPLTNTVGMIWETAFQIPTNANTSVNFVFNDNPNVNDNVATWHSENDEGGRAWRAFIAPIGE